MAINLNEIPLIPNADHFTVDLRAASDIDCDAIRFLFRKTVQSIEQIEYSTKDLFVWAAGADDTTAWIKRIYKQYFIVAEHAGEIIGFGSITHEGYLDLLYVDPSHHGQGIGRKILKKLEAHCLKLNIHEIWADVNSTSRSFFVRHGFRIDQMYTRSVKDRKFENLIMRKILINQDVN